MMGIGDSYITAAIGLAGAIVGGVTSFATTWLTQSVQTKEKLQQAMINRRERLYTEFVNEAARRFGEALSHQKGDICDLATLYAMVAHIRLVASSGVVSAAERVMERIIKTFGEPNRTLSELRIFAHEDDIDPLLQFSQECRTELFKLSEK